MAPLAPVSASALNAQRPRPAPKMASVSLKTIQDQPIDFLKSVSDKSFRTPSLRGYWQNASVGGTIASTQGQSAAVAKNTTTSVIHTQTVRERQTTESGLISAISSATSSATSSDSTASATTTTIVRPRRTHTDARRELARLRNKHGRALDPKVFASRLRTRLRKAYYGILMRQIASPNDPVRTPRKRRSRHVATTPSSMGAAHSLLALGSDSYL